MLNKSMISKRILSISGVILLTGNIILVFAGEVAERSTLKDV